eukprot:gene3818-15107_t
MKSFVMFLLLAMLIVDHGECWRRRRRSGTEIERSNGEAPMTLERDRANARREESADAHEQVEDESLDEDQNFEDPEYFQNSEGRRSDKVSSYEN